MFKSLRERVGEGLSLIVRTLPPLSTLEMPPVLTVAPFLFIFLHCAILWVSSVNAQPDPKVQKGITAAIRAAANSTGSVDYTKFVNVYIGTDNFGDVW